VAAMTSPPTYRDRLRVEGATLAAVGAAGSAVLLATQPEAKRMPAGTIGQLALVAVALARFGPRTGAGAMRAARRVRGRAVGTARRRTYYRLPGSRLGRGTVLGFTRA